MKTEKTKPSTPPVSAKSKPAEDGKKKAEGGLTALQANMKHSLDGARFRSVIVPPGARIFVLR